MKIKRTRNKTQAIPKAMLIRSVASSTAVETGQSIPALEKKLKEGSKKFQHLNLSA